MTFIRVMLLGLAVAGLGACVWERDRGGGYYNGGSVEHRHHERDRDFYGR